MAVREEGRLFGHIDKVHRHHTALGNNRQGKQLPPAVTSRQRTVKYQVPSVLVKDASKVPAQAQCHVKVPDCGGVDETAGAHAKLCGRGLAIGDVREHTYGAKYPQDDTKEQKSRPSGPKNAKKTSPFSGSSF